MDKRNYNIFFDLHTVSGIIISVLAYVIFFAGSFSFFRDEIVNWERNEPVSVRKKVDADIDVVIDTLKNHYNLYGRDISLRRSYDDQRIAVNISESKDTSMEKSSRAGDFHYMNTKTFQRTNYYGSYTLGEFIYRLHFFAQIPYPAGYFLSGFTALFLVFAVITGVLVHWKKIVTNFYVFRPKEKLKTIWTDAHTVLGTIGLPFQFVYAVTGAFFMINIVLVAPTVYVLYNGNADALYEDTGYRDPVYDFEGKKLEGSTSVNAIIAEASALWQNFNITEITLHNYGDEGMHVAVGGELDANTKFNGVGEVVYHYKSNAVVLKKDPYSKTSYLDGVKNVLYRIHFGDYGGVFLRVISFIMGLFACFVVVTGILIWLEARNKKHVPEKTRKFNAWIGHIFLSICLSMLPVTALAFIAVKIVPPSESFSRMQFLYWIYFCPWLLLSGAFTGLRDNRTTNKLTLLSGGVLSLLIPIVNGMSTGNWFWLNIMPDRHDLLVVDVLWIAIACLCFYALFRMKKAGTTATTTGRTVKVAAVESNLR